MTDSTVHEARAPQEPDLVSGSRLLRLTLLSVIVAAFGVLLSWWLGAAQMSHSAPPMLGKRAQNTLEQGPIRSGGRATELKASQKQRLSSYGWVDRKAGIAHIPIERAIEIRAQESR